MFLPHSPALRFSQITSFWRRALCVWFFVGLCCGLFQSLNAETGSNTLATSTTETRNGNETDKETASLLTRKTEQVSPEKFSFPPALKDENRMPISGKNEGVPIYLMNRAGKLIAVPGIQLELIDDLLRSLPGTATAEGKASLPDFIFHSVLAEGEVEPNVIKMRVKFQIETFAEAPIAVPLRFNEGILLSRTPKKEQATKTETKTESDARRAFYSQIAQELRSQTLVDRVYHGPGEVWVEYAEQNGFTAWITGKGIHSVELTFLVPYTRSLTGENQLKVQFPYATMSEMKLKIPQTRNESERLSVSMTGGTTLDTPYFVRNQETENTALDEEGATYVSAIRLGGELWLSWNVSPLEKTTTPDILEADGLILAVIGKNSVTYDARMKILRKNNEINTLRFRLPANAELLPCNTANYSVTIVQTSKDAVQRGVIAEITLKKPITGLVRVDIHAKVPIQTGNEEADWFNMAGFEFLSAVRQSGYYAIKMASGKHANWTPGAGMRRLEELPAPLELWEPVKNVESEKSPLVSESRFTTENTVFSSTMSGLQHLTANSTQEADAPTTVEVTTQQLEELLTESEAKDAPKMEPKEVAETESEVGAVVEKNIAQEVKSEVKIAPVTENTEWGFNKNTSIQWDAVFEYDSQPTQLWTRIVERTTRVNVEPKYIVSVTQDRLILNATWNCTIRGGKISWIDVSMNGWNFVSCGPENLVAVDKVNEISPPGSENKKISIMFTQPIGNHATLTFRAERSLTPKNKRFEFQLPQKVGGEIAQTVITSAPAELRILSASNLEITPRTAECRRLVRQPLPASLERQNSASSSVIIYRCESDDALFSANYNIHSRQTNVRQYTQIEIYRQEYRVRQTFDYSVAHESLNQLYFLIPEMNPENVDIQISPVNATNPNTMSTSPSATTSTAPIPVLSPSAEKRYTTLKTSLEAAPQNAVVAEENAPESFTENETEVGNVSSVPAPENMPENPSVIPPEPVIETTPVETAISPALPSVTPVIPSISPMTQHAIKFRPLSERQGFTEVEILLNEERLGMFTVTISYTLPMPQLTMEKQERLEILLGSSQDGKITENLLELASDDGLEMTSPREIDPESPWEEMGAFMAQTQFKREMAVGEKPRNILPEFLCKSLFAQNQIIVGVALQSVSTQEITIVDRCWLQTWIVGENRQDRAVFLFPPVVNMQNENGNKNIDFSEVAPTRTFTIHLPQRASVDTAEVWIDHQPAQFGTQLKRLSANVLQVTLLPTSQPRQSQTVEIRYQFDTESLRNGFREMEAPYVKDSTWIRGLYWQLILPSNMHLIQAPTGFALEYRWGWGSCFWGRLPIWEQETLERWSGAVVATPAPLRMNRYVLAGMGSNEALTREIIVGFVNRTTLVTVLSIAVFLFGILFLYLKILSRPLPRLLLFVILGAFAVRFPEFALLGLQATTLGALLFFVSVIFGLKRKFRRKMVVHEPSEDNTVHHGIVAPTIIAPAEGSQHAFKTITYEQNMGVGSSDDSTIFRK